MKPFFSKTLNFALILGLILISAGCDSGSNDEEVSESFDQMGEMIEKSFDIFGDVAVEVLLGGTAKSQPTYDCDQSGTVDWDVTGVANQYALTFNSCNGIDGNSTMGLTTNFTETSIEFALALSGTLTESCTMTLNNFTMDAASSESGDSEITLSGSISSTCNGEAFACTFNADELTDDAGEDFFRDRCSASIG